MHVGLTSGPGAARPFLKLEEGVTGGAVSEDGRIAGCYVHGVFTATAARAAFVAALGARSDRQDHSARVDAALNEIAAVLESCLDIGALAAMARG
jgi:adenosylcobyric acid synthase